MHCFASHKKVRHNRKSLAEQDAAAKMTRTLSAPATFTLPDSHHHHPTLSSILSEPSPLNPQTPSRKQKTTGVSSSSSSSVIRSHDGSSSPLITHSGSSLPSGYNSLTGLRRESGFRGQPLPLPTPESCGLSSADIPAFMPSPALSKAGCSVAGTGATSSTGATSTSALNSACSSSTSLDGTTVAVFRKSASMPLPRPPVEKLASAHTSFSPETCCIGESGNGPAFTCTVSFDGVQESAQAVLIRLSDTTMQDSKAWITDVKEIACVRDSHLSRILGFSFSTDELLVVYEVQANGSLDRLLYGRSRERPPLDWCTRVRIAAEAARGLAFLHERSPNKLMYKDFRTFNIHVDKEMRARLMGYGFTQRSMNTKSPMVAAYAAPELLSGSPAASTKSNVWSFGVVMLEILTGRQNRDEMFPVGEQDLVKWTEPYLSDEKKLFLIVDPELKGMYPAKSVSSFAKLACQCLQADPSLRPDMDHVARSLESSLQQQVDVKVGGTDSRKPLIEALKESTSPCSSPARFNNVHQPAYSRRLVTKLLCSSAVALN